MIQPFDITKAQPVQPAVNRIWNQLLTRSKNNWRSGAGSGGLCRCRSGGRGFACVPGKLRNVFRSQRRILTVVARVEHLMYIAEAAAETGDQCGNVQSARGGANLEAERKDEARVGEQRDTHGNAVVAVGVLQAHQMLMLRNELRAS